MTESQKRVWRRRKRQALLAGVQAGLNSDQLIIITQAFNLMKEEAMRRGKNRGIRV